MEKSYNYSDIYLVPKYSKLKSRKDANTSVEFLDHKFEAPWIPANMQSVINMNNAKWLSENGYFYIHHRFGDNMELVGKMNEEEWKIKSISVGVKQGDMDFIASLALQSIWQFPVDFITIDIAHGHSILMKEMIEFIRQNLPEAKIIAGNVCTPEAVRDLASWGADAVKVGIAGGGACSTKNMTGFHIPMFSCVKDCAYGLDEGLGMRIDCPIIADGGIRENGDVAKALVAGAKMVMAGSIFAACIDAPGENIYSKKVMQSLEECKESERICESMNAKAGEKRFFYAPDVVTKIEKKRYFGSASAKQKGEKRNVEGFELEIPCNGLTYSEKYKELTESLQSSISYGGGNDLSCFKDVQWVAVK